MHAQEVIFAKEACNTIKGSGRIVWVWTALEYVGQALHDDPHAIQHKNGWTDYILTIKMEHTQVPKQ